MVFLKLRIAPSVSPRLSSTEPRSLCAAAFFGRSCATVLYAYGDHGRAQGKGASGVDGARQYHHLRFLLQVKWPFLEVGKLASSRAGSFWGDGDDATKFFDTVPCIV